VRAIGFKSVISEGVYTCFFHDRIAIQSQKTHKVARCKQTQSEGKEENVCCHALLLCNHLSLLT